MTNHEEAAIIVWVVLTGTNKKPEDFAYSWNYTTHAVGWTNILNNLRYRLR